MSAATPARSRHYWMPFVIVVLTAIVIAVINFTETFDKAMHATFSIMAVMLGLFFCWLWFMFFTGFPWRVRYGLTGVAAAAIGGFFALFRVEGFDGDVLPKFTWRWTPIKDTTLPPIIVAPDAGATLDFTPTRNDFPRFLGPTGQPRIMDKSLEHDWQEAPPKLLWKQPIGAGWSAFAVVGMNAVTQEQRGDQELTVCYDVPTGKPRWTHANGVRFSEALGGDGPRATPTIHEGRVYVLGATGILDCLDAPTGKRIWTADTLKEAGQENLEWAKSSSPLIVDDLVIISLGKKDDGPALAAYDRNTGKRVWTAVKDRASYASPVLATLLGKRQIISVNARSVTGHEPADGKELWRYDWPGEFAKCSQPVQVLDDRVYLSAGYGLGSVLLQFDPSPDGVLKPKELWKSNRMRTRFTNVAINVNFVYGLDDGILACQELLTGRMLWKGGRYQHGQILLVGLRLLVLSEDGQLVLVEATPDRFNEIARLPALSGKTWNNLALAGKYLLIRNAEEAACYEMELGPAPPPSGPAPGGRRPGAGGAGAGAGGGGAPPKANVDAERKPADPPPTKADAKPDAKAPAPMQ